MKYEDALDWLYRRQRFGVKLGLDTIRALLDRLEKPEEAFRAFHVTGSNGKGSTCAYLDSILRAAGHKVGLYTSPHLVSFRERIHVDGQQISEEDVARGVERIRPHVDDLEARRMPATFFECVTALALDHFRQAGVPLAVVEVGLGGRLDATNFVNPVASVITNIGLEHTDRLGTSIQAIASEKAGILRPGIPCATAARREALDVLAKESMKRKVPLKVVRRPDPVEETLEGIRFKATYQGTSFDAQSKMLGEHQAENAILAVAAVDAAGSAAVVEPEALRKGLADAFWPGRLEVVDHEPLTLLDGAHNGPAMDALAAFLGRHFQPEDVAVCVGVLRDKSAQKMMSHLAPRVGRTIVTEPPSARALPARELGYVFPPDAPAPNVVPDASEALRALFTGGNERARLVTGSLFLVGHARAQILRLPRDPGRPELALQ